MNRLTCQPERICKVNNWIDIIQDYLLPPICLLCGEPGSLSRDLCRNCHEALILNTRCCYRCAGPLEIADSLPRLCGSCLKQRPKFDETFAPFLYRGAIRYFIYCLKYRASIKNARLLGTLLAEFLSQATAMPDCIIPVPLHRSRYLERGFNQSLEIARITAKQLQIPLDYSSCRRTRNTPHQTGLAAKLRRKNMRNAFSIVKPISAQHIAILDDVMTTGTTVNELAKTLKLSGISRVDVWACARA